MVNDLDYDAFLKEACLDLAWRKYRRRAARRRVRDRINELGLADYQSYLNILRENGEEAARFPDRIRLTLSRFFREKERWEALASSGIPSLLEESPSPLFKVWSAGCCGGEEPYSLALLWRDQLEGQYPGQPIVITATDIDEPSLQRPRKGVTRPLPSGRSPKDTPKVVPPRWKPLPAGHESQGAGELRKKEPPRRRAGWRDGSGSLPLFRLHLLSGSKTAGCRQKAVGIDPPRRPSHDRP